MYAIDLLEQHHRQVEALFDRWDVCPAEQRAEVWKVLSDYLDAHTYIEEQHFYPACRNGDLDDLVAKFLSAHAQAEQIIKELRNVPVDDAAFQGKMSLLRENVERHVKEEEFELFPAAKEYLGEPRLNQLGQQMQEAFRRRIPSEMAAEALSTQEEEAEELEVEFEPEFSTSAGSRRPQH